MIPNLGWQAIEVNKAARCEPSGHGSGIVWFTGISGSGKSTIASLAEKRLHTLGMRTYLLDGDSIRLGLNKDLGFANADRAENIRRTSEVAKLMTDAGLLVLVSLISPFREERRMARTLVGPNEFCEVFVDTPIQIAEQRDPKGLYKRARRGELPNFTGIDSPYEVPEHPELRIETASTTPERAVELVLARMRDMGLL
jgi:bifunctional enzyme CysN/CysC